MEKDHELIGWDEEYSPKFGRKALPGSRAARHCSFGITESLGAFLASTLADVGIGTAAATAVPAATALGVTLPATSFIGGGLLGAGTTAALGTGLAGAAEGALSSGVTGGNPLTGALTGGLGAGFGSAFGSDIGSALGVSPGLGGALAGAGGGLLGSALTGGNLLTGALGGGAVGYGAGAGAGPTAPTPAAGLAGGGSSAISGALPGVGGGLGGSVSALPDLTTGVSGAGQGLGSLSNPGIVGTNAALGLTPAAAAIPAAAAPAAATGGGLGSIGSSVLSGIEKNPLQAVNTVLGITQANQQQKALENTVKTVNNLATGQSASAANLESALTTGQLPPGAQAAVNSATASAKAQVRAKYASLGLTGSTMETQELNSIDQQAAGQIFSLADQLYQTGISQSGLTTQLYDAILQAQGGLSNQYRSALANYSAAIGGGNYAPGTTGTG